MTKMYIANCTKQIQDFPYQLPGVRGLRRQMIPIGSQILISGDLSTMDIDAIVEQHSIYGLKAVSEVAHAKAFVGLCYSLDAPVKLDTIEIALHHNAEVLDAMGRRIRAEAAVAMHAHIASTNANNGGGLDALEMSVVEDRSGRTVQGVHLDHAPIADGVRVTKDSTGTLDKPVKGRRGGRKAE